MLKRITFVAICTLLFVGVVVSITFAQNKRRSSRKRRQQVSATKQKSSIPTGDVIRLQTKSGVMEVKNFYKTAVHIDETNVLLQETDDFIVSYFRKDSSFLISLTSAPLAQARKRAEESFLNILQVKKEDACKLEVQVKFPDWLEIQGAGGNYGLSFCPGSKRL